MLFTESTWNCLLVLNRDLSTVFFFWESGSLAESPFAPFWSSCSPKDPYGFTNAEHSWSWTKWTRVPTRSRAGYISLTVVSVCHGSNVSLNRGEAWAKSLNIIFFYVCMDTISACICKNYHSALNSMEALKIDLKTILKCLLLLKIIGDQKAWWQTSYNSHILYIV